LGKRFEHFLGISTWVPRGESISELRPPNNGTWGRIEHGIASIPEQWLTR
jgi:hypothetical protein